ncbi:MAG: FecR family protein, partial [Pedobacter sp.]
FNINSYSDETNIKTTLVEGSVRLSQKNADAKAVVLKPGEQGINDGAKFRIGQVQVAEVIAWKNGDFAFNEEKMSNIIKQLERWYNVEIVLSDDLGEEEFTGRIDRNRNIRRVLNMMEKTNSIQFKIEGRRITAIAK